MSSDTKSSGPSSGPTSSSAAGRPKVDVGLPRSEAAKRTDPKDKDYDRAFDPTVEDKALTVDEYLRRQGERAKRAIVGAATHIKDDTAAAVTSSKSSAGSAASAYNPLHLVQERPWIAMAVSAGAGFVGTMWWHPGRYGKVRKRLAALEKRFKAHEKEVVEVKAVGGDPNTGKKTAAAGLSAAVLHQVMAAARPFVMERLAPLMSGLTGGQAAAGTEDGNGSDPDHRRDVGGMASGSVADRLNPSI